jgi:hypothetical protein
VRDQQELRDVHQDQASSPRITVETGIAEDEGRVGNAEHGRGDDEDPQPQKRAHQHRDHEQYIGRVTEKTLLREGGGKGEFH